jgi:uncharacterized protein YcbK (DUF882 family)
MRDLINRFAGRLAYLGASAAIIFVAISHSSLQDAVANGDTRTISIYHTHTKESATITFRRDGAYDREALKKLNWLLRDWRRDEPIDMDPRLFDIIWQVQRDVGTNQPLHVVSAYRSPQTNSMLRRRSRGVAKDSQHTLGKAIDFYLPDVEMSKVRTIAMKLQHGGVGFYPSAFNPFVHLDAGSVRSWPRMPREQLARLFPTGRTVHIPADGKPMDGYDVAKADILSNGGAVGGLAYADAGENVPTTSGPRKSLWASLFGGADEDEDVEDSRPKRGGGRQVVASARPSQVSAYAPSNSHDNNAGMFNINPVASNSAPAAPASQPASRAVRNIAPAPVAQPETAEAVAVAAVVPEPQPATPLPTARPVGLTPITRPGAGEQTRLAALAATASGLATPQTAPDAQLDAKALTIVPLPPRRPDGLTAGPVLVDVPMPPSRPVELASLSTQLRPSAATPLADGQAGIRQPAPPPLRGSTTEASNAISAPALVMVDVKHPSPPPRPLIAQSADVQATTLKPAAPQSPIVVSSLARQPVAIPVVRESTKRQDELKSLFAAVASEATPKRSANVSTARTRAAATTSVSVALPEKTIVSRFGKSADAPRADRFSGPAVKPLPTTSFTRE